MAAQPYLSVKGLRKHYGSGDTLTQVLKGITADVMQGETCVLLGPSGSCLLYTSDAADEL